MKIYQVGGCVRDKLLGISPKDVDYVVVGATEEQMLNLGFEKVGKDFPVFLHPETKDEYALARKEIKVSEGYNGFEVITDNISLEDDLFRRDLTMNAIAMDESGNIIDPFGGASDLKNKIIKHVSEHFSEDPVRILRAARFSARYNFTIHPETKKFMQDMVNNGEFNHLTQERVWKEFEKTLSEPHIFNFFIALNDINALTKLPNLSMPSSDDFNFIFNHAHEDRFILNAFIVFKNFTAKQFNSWKIPTEISEILLSLQDFQKVNKPFSDFNVNEKLLFIKQVKSIHDLDHASYLLKLMNINLMRQNIIQDWKKQTANDLNLLTQCTNNLKNIDYDYIKQNTDVKNLKQVILQAQIDALNSINNSHALKTSIT